jgi:hypothetical protein
MPLDLTRLVPQMQAYAPRLHTETAQLTAEAARLREVLASLAGRWPTVDDARAGFLEDPTLMHTPPAAPTTYRVIATDGSQVAADRHEVASCYVINIGTVSIEYGRSPGAALGSVPELLSDQPEPTEGDNDDPEMPPPSRQTSLELERAAAELRTLRQMVEASPPDLFTVALVDNSLVLWSQTMNAEKARDHEIVKEYIGELEAFAALARRRPIALAGYLSHPGSPWVADLVRQSEGDNAAAATAVLDRQMFDGLAEGTRSARFRRVAPMLKLDGYPAECAIDFCYLRSGGEIARVEMPRWVSRDPELLGLTHAAILDQCRRNAGNPAYPVALMEAHEQAVVSEADRRAFWRLIGEQLVAQGLNGEPSAKSRTKRTPWI